MRAVWMLRQIGVWLLVVVIVLGCVAASVGYWAASASLPDYNATVRIPELGDRVTVYRDEYGVPQVYADSADDLFRAQGYLHAVDRFWEMDFRRHVTAGRLSELFGPDQVDTDAFIRTMGWRRVAAEEFPKLSPETQGYLKAYAAGVNAWIDDHSGAAASLEYAVLGLRNRNYRIEPWSPVDSLAWLKAMAWDLRSNLSEEIERARLLASGLSRDQVGQLFPDYPYAQHQPILTSGALVSGTFQPGATVTPAGGQAGGGEENAVDGALRGLGGRLDRLADTIDGVPDLLGTNGQGIGSNSWVLSGSRTSTGKPILANDPHLGPAMPSVWYQMGLHCTTKGPKCPFDVTGFSFSGMPGIIIGHNDRIAWGLTNLGPDVADLYLERIRGNAYQRDGEMVPLTSRRERISVAGGKDVTITIRGTVHGPLLSDQDDDLRDIGRRPGVDTDGLPTDGRAADPAYGLALRWTGLDPGRTADAVFALNKAANFTDFRNAARLFAVPAQNLLYADVDGHIGYQAPGAIPVRGSDDGLYPTPGWDTNYDWVSMVPFDQLPYAEDPPAGYITAANQAPVAAGAGPTLGYDWDYGYRSQRITSLITAANRPLGVDDMAQMQLDTHSALADALVPKLLTVPASGDAQRARRLLVSWDHADEANSAAAAYFNAVWKHLLTLTFDELPRDLAPDGGSRWFDVVGTLLDDPDSPWWDDRGTRRVERRDEFLRKALADAATELTHRLGDDPQKWEWGKLHTLTIRNQSLGTSGVGYVEWLFNRGPHETGGGSSVVTATGWDASKGYEVDWVPSMRMVVDLGNLDRSRWINLTGASGHAFSDHYDDQTKLWLAGETTPMRWKAATIRSEARYHQTLRP